MTNHTLSRDWREDSVPVDFSGDIMRAVETLRACHRKSRSTREFGWLAGLTLGRLLAMDSSSGNVGHWHEPLRAVYAVIGDWTFFDPEYTAYLLSTMDPVDVYTVILFWPEKMTDYKVFLIGALLGMAMEGLRGTDFLTEKPERAEMLLDMLEEDV